MGVRVDMNNQVKPTDTKKLLEWLEARIEASKLKPVWFAYREMQKAVLVGTFAPDTPPVPTIKPGDKPKQSCPRCGNTGIHYCRGQEVAE
jgi:hypothetical protein